MQEQMNVINGLQKTVTDLTKKLDQKPVVANKPVAMNARDVQTLEKSEQVPEMLAKSDLLDFVRTEQRNGNKKIDTAMVFDITTASNPDQMRRVYANAEQKGIKLPMKTK